MNKISQDTKKILVVEDEPAISKLCQLVLTREGYEVDIATDGEVAQEMIMNYQYQIIITDIKMPKLDGKELYKWLKEKTPQLADRVLFMTGSPVGDATSNFLEQSNRPYLLKPFSTGELRDAVNNALEEIGT